MGCGPSKTAKYNPPFPKLGVKLQVFDEFMEKCGGYEEVKNLTTTQIRYKFLTQKSILPTKTSYCDYLQSINHPGVGIATVFISHAWKYKFVDVLDALQHQFRDNKDTFVWFDLFSNNQNLTKVLDFEWWTGTFKSAIRQFGHTVVVLAPWDDPEPLKR
jgi:hypothetical protein